MANPIDFELLLKDEKFQAALKKAARSIGTVDKKLKQVKTTSQGSFSTKKIVQFGVALVGVQTAALAARKGMQLMINTAVKSVKTFAKFEKSMLAVRTLLDETSFAGKTASEGFKQMGKDMTKVLQSIPVDAQEASKALFDITSAQINAADATTVLTAAGKLAVAGNAKVSTTTNAVVKSIVAFGLEASDATNIAAKFFTAQKLGLTTVQELSDGIGLVAAQASQMGVSLDEVLGSIVGTTRGALGTRRAFVGLAAAFKNILKPSEDAKAVAKQYGIELSEAGVKAKGGFIPFLVDLNKKVKGSSKALTTIFSQARAFKQVSALLTKSGTKGAVDAVNALGDSAKNSKTLTDNYTRAVKGLSNQWNTFTNNIGEIQKALVQGLAPAFGDVLKEATEGLKELFKEIQTPEIQQSLKTLGESISQLFQGVKRLLPELNTFVTTLGGLVTIASAVTNSITSIGEGSEVSLTKAAIASNKLLEAENALLEVQRRSAIDGNQAFMLRGQEESLKVLIKHLRLKVNTLNLAEKEVKVINAMTSSEKLRLNNQLSHLKKLTGDRIDAEKKVALAKRTAEGKAQVAADKELQRIEDLSAAWAKQSKDLAGQFDRASESANKFADRRISSAQSIGKTELEIALKTLNARKIELDRQLSAEEISHAKFNEAILAEDLIYLDKKIAAEDKARNEKEKKDLASLQKLQSLAIGGLNSLTSGFKTQAGVTSAKSSADKASQDLSRLARPNTSSSSQADKAVADREKEIKSLEGAIREVSRSIANSSSKVGKEARRQQKLTLQNNLAISRDKLKVDKKIADGVKKENKSRESAITKGLSDVKDANLAVDESIVARDQEAKKVSSDLIAASVGAAFGPAAGALTGPILDALTGSPEEASAFIDSLVDQIPLLIDALVQNAPAIIETLVKAAPDIAKALIEAMPAVAFAALEAVGRVVVNVLGQGIRQTLIDLGIIKEKKTAPTLSDEELKVLSNAGVDPAELQVGQAAIAANQAIAEDVKTPDVVVVQNTQSAEDLINNRTPFATGGFVTGSGNRDTVPAVLTPGELVVDRTTGPRLNRFLDTAEGRGISTSSSASLGDTAILAEILSEVRKPIQVRSDVKVNDDTFAEIILDLDRRNARTVA